MKTTEQLRTASIRADERGWMSENYLGSGSGKSVFS
jgi:GTP-dependent phosphoenolpyruvate carboxykinase